MAAKATQELDDADYASFMQAGTAPTVAIETQKPLAAESIEQGKEENASKEPLTKTKRPNKQPSHLDPLRERLRERMSMVSHGLSNQDRKERAANQSADYMNELAKTNGNLSKSTERRLLRHADIAQGATTQSRFQTGKSYREMLAHKIAIANQLLNGFKPGSVGYFEANEELKTLLEQQKQIDAREENKEAVRRQQKLTRDADRLRKRVEDLSVQNSNIDKTTGELALPSIPDHTPKPLSALKPPTRRERRLHLQAQK